jgi:choline-sulfatase
VSITGRRAAWGGVLVCLFGSAVGCDGCNDRGQASTTPPQPPATIPSVAVSVVDAAPPTRPPEKLNVILISIDCLRADMPWAGYPRPIAPRLTELEKRSVDFSHAYSLSSYTSMSLGGMLGGKLPGELRRDGYFFGTYGKENLFFPEVLHEHGIRTIAAHAHGYFKDAKFDQGFDVWELVPNMKWNNTTDENITAPQQEAIAEKLLGDPALEATRFFAWFHFLDPHDLYLPHEGIGPYGKQQRDRYDAEVTFTDRYIGKLLDFVAARSWSQRTAIVVTADHGEAFGEHKQFFHGFELWENLVRIPLFVVLPNASPRKIDEPRSAIDVAPTILDLFGIPADPGFEGKSLVPDLYGVKPEPRDIAIDLPATSDNDRRRAFLHGKYKLIAFGTEAYNQVFDLEADPEEKSPIVRGEAFADMVSRFKAYEKTLKDVPPYQCKETCLNGAYLKPRDAGASPEEKK